MSKKELIITLSAPSGTGKGSVCAALLAMDNKISFFATATTRDMRTGEKDGIDYHFLTKDTFKQYVSEGNFLEWVEYNGNFYGTLRSVVEEKLDAGLDVISDLTWDGVLTLRKEWKQQTLSFLFMPPSADELEKRLKIRQQKSHESDTAMDLRIAKGAEDANRHNEENYQFTSPDLIGSHANDYDYVIINENLDDTVNQVHDIILKERANRG